MGLEVSVDSQDHRAAVPDLRGVQGDCDLVGIRLSVHHHISLGRILHPLEEEVPVGWKPLPELCDLVEDLAGQGVQR